MSICVCESVWKVQREGRSRSEVKQASRKSLFVTFVTLPGLRDGTGAASVSSTVCQNVLGRRLSCHSESESPAGRLGCDSAPLSHKHSSTFIVIFTQSQHVPPPSPGFTTLRLQLLFHYCAENSRPFSHRGRHGHEADCSLYMGIIWVYIPYMDMTMTRPLYEHKIDYNPYMGLMLTTSHIWA